MTLRFFTFLLLLTLGLTLPGWAQSAAAPAPDQYCALIVTGNHYSAMSLRLEYGQDNDASAVPSLKEEAARVRYLSLVGALNHLSKLGWELVASNTMPISGGAAMSEYYSEQQYILRRRR